MASDSSFDIVSDFDQQELVNALDQSRREIATRYDFKGSKVAYELGKDSIVLVADDDYRAGAAKDLLESKAVRRNLSLKIFEWGKIEPAAGGTVRQEVTLRRGLTSEQAKELSKHVREAFPKTKPAIQGDAVRVSAKSRDELQAVIADLKALDYPIALQFINYR
ncbi:MAG: YajQ family cyclic di-GMP-binding protein [Candidatus Limnocylindria bacterium]